MDDLEMLKKPIRASLEENLRLWKHKMNYHKTMHASFVVVSIAMSAAITIVGIFNLGIAAAILGALLAAVLAFQQVFPFSEMSFFYRVGTAEAERLRLDLNTRADTQPEIEALEVQLETLIQRMAQEIPRGLAVQDVAQKMVADVRAAQ